MGGMIDGASDATYDGGRAGQLVYWLAVVAVSIALNRPHPLVRGPGRIRIDGSGSASGLTV